MMSGVLQSHTATQQWQSFEVRMRRRRIERCVLRASVAIEAGVLDDAREALEEVQRLHPREPSIETLNAQLAAAEAAPAPLPPIELSFSEVAVSDPMVDAPLDESARGHAWHYVMALVLVALSGGAGWLWFSDRPAVEPAVIALA